MVLATGSRAIGDVPWKASLAGYEATKEGLHKVQKQVKDAKSIVVGGAGELANFSAFGNGRKTRKPGAGRAVSLFRQIHA